MAWLNNRIHIQWSLFQRFLAIACIIIFIPLTIAALVIIGIIPVYLINHAVYITRSTDVSPFNVTYLLVDQSRSGLNFDSIDRIKLARSFERGLSLKVRNVLQIGNIYPDTAIGNNTKLRRKRFVQCDQDLSGPVLTFDFNLTYPINRLCQNQKCVNKTFAEVYQQFQSVPSLFVDFNNISRELRLCSFGVKSYSVSNTQNSNATPSSTEETNMNNSSTETSIIGTISSNFTSNETDVDINNCLRKLPITQEPVPPYRINHTSTLFFQDDHSLVVVGASKFETFIEMNIIKRDIIINGIMVYTNCQRTIDISLPMICHNSTSW